MWPPLGTWPATQACAPTGNQTSNPSVHSLYSIHWATPARAICSFELNILYSLLYHTQMLFPQPTISSLCLLPYLTSSSHPSFRYQPRLHSSSEVELRSLQPIMFHSFVKFHRIMMDTWEWRDWDWGDNKHLSSIMFDIRVKECDRSINWDKLYERLFWQYLSKP